MDINAIWLVAEPYVNYLIQLLTTSGILGIVATLIYKRLAKKVDNVNTANTVANAVVNSIAGKDLKVSLESVNKKQLNNVREEILSTFNGVFETVANQTVLLAAMAQVMIRFKAATPEEKEAIINACAKLEGAEIKQEKTEPIVVTIDPVETVEVEQDNSEIL